MKIELASSYGFCFGVKRAIRIAEEHRGSKTYGPLIHNKDEINRLKEGFDIGLAEKLGEKKSLTIRFFIQSMEDTLKDSDIESVMNSIMGALEEACNAQIR